MKGCEEIVGTRIYYRGDMANREGFGTITAYIPNARFGGEVGITMDDGRYKRIPPCMIKAVDTGNGLTRFVTIDGYNEYRAQALADMQARYAALLRKAG